MPAIEHHIVIFTEQMVTTVSQYAETLRLVVVQLDENKQNLGVELEEVWGSETSA